MAGYLADPEEGFGIELACDACGALPLEECRPGCCGYASMWDLAEDIREAGAL